MLDTGKCACDFSEIWAMRWGEWILKTSEKTQTHEKNTHPQALCDARAHHENYTRYNFRVRFHICVETLLYEVHVIIALLVFFSISLISLNFVALFAISHQPSVQASNFSNEFKTSSTLFFYSSYFKYLIRVCFEFIPTVISNISGYVYIWIST